MRNDDDKWIPIQVEKIDLVTHARRVRNWRNNPTSDPELERWSLYGFPKGLPFEVLKQTQDEIDFGKYHPIYLEAVDLEGKGETIKALNLYLNILNSFTPSGTSYYENPIYLLENKGDYQTAISVCEKAIKEITKNNFKGDVNLFTNLKMKLENKL